MSFAWRERADSFDHAAKNDNTPVNFGFWNLQILYISTIALYKLWIIAGFPQIQKRQLNLEFVQLLWMLHQDQYA